MEERKGGRGGSGLWRKGKEKGEEVNREEKERKRGRR